MNANETRLYSVIIKTADRLRLEADQVLLEAANITAAQGAVMAVVVKDPNATQSDIAQALDLSEPAVTQMIGRLQRDGLIDRQRDQTDRRRWQLRLTELGQERVRQANTAFQSINAILDDVLDEAGVKSLSTQLNEVRAALKDRSEPHS